MLRTILRGIREYVKRASPLYRRFLIVDALVVLVAVIGLSAAARRPYFSQHSATWHTAKVSRMAETRSTASRQLRALDEGPAFPSDAGTQPLRLSCPCASVVPQFLSYLISFQFRSPPLRV